MSEFILTRSGAELVESLNRDCGFGIEAARRFIESRSREPFEAERLYSVGYSARRRGRNWSRFDELRIWKRSAVEEHASADRFHPEVEK